MRTRAVRPRTRLRATLTGALALAVAVVPLLVGAPPASAVDWTPITDVGPGSEASGGFDVAINSSGHAVLAWPSGGTVQVARRQPGQPWSAPEQVALVPGGQPARAVRALIGEDGRVHVVWGAGTDDAPQSVLHARTMDPAGNWGPVQTTAAAQPLTVSAATAADGSAVVRWTNTVAGYAAVVEAGGAWGPVQTAPGGPGTYDTALGVFRDKGGVTVLWNSDPAPRTAYTTTWRNGQWSAPETAFTGSTTQPTSMAANADGIVVTATSPLDANAVVLRFRGPQGTWQAPLTISQPSPSTPSVAIDAQGRALVTWISGPGGAQRVMAVTADPWTGVGAVTELSVPGWYSEPTAFLGDGGATVAWRVAAGVYSGVSSRTWVPRTGWGPIRSVGAGKADGARPASAVAENGDAALAWVNNDGRLRVATLDRTPPVIGSLGWSGARAGAPTTFTVTSTDAWSELGVAWEFGDGAIGEGLSAAHTYARAGTFTVTVTVTDAAGNSVVRRASVTVEPGADAGAGPTARGISRFALSRDRIRLKGAAKKRRTRATIVLAEGGTVQIAWTKRVTRTRNGKKHTVVKTVARHSYDLAAGRNKIVLTAKVGRKKIKPGRYVLVASSATNKRKAKLRVTR